jgi:hypothetical protein
VAIMGRYCKAYSIVQFREYPNWSERSEKSGKETKAGGESPGEPANPQYLFLHENLVVTDGVFMDENVVFDGVTPAWEEFCKKQLRFEVPDFSPPVKTQQSAAGA